MKTFIQQYKMFKSLKRLGDYRFCWIPLNNGNGIYSIIEFFDEELPKIDKNKVEIIIL